MGLVLFVIVLLLHLKCELDGWSICRIHLILKIQEANEAHFLSEETVLIEDLSLFKRILKGG